MSGGNVGKMHSKAKLSTPVDLLKTSINKTEFC